MGRGSHTCTEVHRHRASHAQSITYTEDHMHRGSHAQRFTCTEGHMDRGSHAQRVMYTEDICYVVMNNKERQPVFLLAEEAEADSSKADSLGPNSP